LIEVEAGGYVPRFRPRIPQPLPPGPQAVKGPRPFRKLVALDLLRQATHHLKAGTPDSLVRSLALFERAALANPEQERAYLGVAGASIGMSVTLFEPPLTALRRARSAVERALELNPGSAEAYNLMGALMALQDFDVAGANHRFLMALRLQPDSESAHMARALLYLAPRGLLSEAIAELSKLRQRNRFQIRYVHHLALLHYLNRDYAAAIRSLQETLALSAAYTPARFLLGWSYERLGDQGRANEILLSEDLLSAYPLAPLRAEALRLAQEGRDAEALRVAERMEAAYAPGIIDPLTVAFVFAVLGEKDKAFQWLERAHEDRRFWLLYMKSDPAHETLRTDARFAQLIARLGL